MRTMGELGVTGVIEPPAGTLTGLIGAARRRDRRAEDP
jgi:hypothetical protein